MHPGQRQVGAGARLNYNLPSYGVVLRPAGDGQRLTCLDGQRIVGEGVVGIWCAALNCKAAVIQRICHSIEHRKQGVKNLRAGDFLFFFIGQGLVCVIGRLQVGIDRALFLLGHSGQRLRRGQGVDELLHILHGQRRGIRGGGKFCCAFTLAQVCIFQTAYRAIGIDIPFGAFFRTVTYRGFFLFLSGTLV